MNIRELGYVLIGATDVEKWRSYATDVLGTMAVSGPGNSLYLKTDARYFRLAVVPDARDRLLACGWGVQTEEAFEAALAHLRAAGVQTVAGTPEECALRKVVAMFHFADPAGNQHEVFCGPQVDPLYFVSPVGVRRFLTNDLGLCHVVLPTNDRFEDTVRFWREVCKFSPIHSRYALTPSGERRSARFFACNDRQHNLALAEADTPSGCLHLNLEVETLDEVGRAFDRASRTGWVVRSLGKHVCDAVVSFYLQTPAGFQIEYGFEDGPLEWAKGLFYEDALGSYWGHQWVPGAAAVPDTKR